MIAPLELVPFVTLGLLGSLHCAGMCGGFALAVARPHGAEGRGAAARLSSYAVGKALAYAVLALLVATGSHVLAGASGAPGDRGPVLARTASALGLAAGVVLVVMGLATLGARLGGAGAAWRRASERVARPVRALFAGARGLQGHAGTFSTGVVNGLLPCGLSWSAVLLATTVAPATAAAGAFLFGLATAPVLFGVGLGPRLLPAAWRVRARPVLGLALVVFGVLTCLRVAPLLAGGGGGSAACCVEHARG